MCIRPCSHSGLGRRQKISRDYPALSVPDRKQGLKGNFSGPVRPTRNRRVSISVITIYWLHVRVIYGPSIGGHRARALDGSLRDGISVNVRSTCFFFFLLRLTLTRSLIFHLNFFCPLKVDLRGATIRKGSHVVPPGVQVMNLTYLVNTNLEMTRSILQIFFV